MWARHRPHGGKSDRNCSEAVFREEWSFKWQYDQRESREKNGRGLPRPKLWLGQISLYSEDQLQGSFSHSRAHTHGSKLLRAAVCKSKRSRKLVYEAKDCVLFRFWLWHLRRWWLNLCCSSLQNRWLLNAFSKLCKIQSEEKKCDSCSPLSFPMENLLHDGMKQR